MSIPSVGSIAPCGGGGRPKSKASLCGGGQPKSIGHTVHDIVSTIDLKDIQKWNDIQQIDLGVITELLCDQTHGIGWNTELASKIEARYKHFLWLCVTSPGIIHVPDNEVDALWHKHILDTRKYASDCALYLGYFLHHNQGYGSTKDEKDTWIEDFHKTNQLLAVPFPNQDSANDNQYKQFG